MAVVGQKVYNITLFQHSRGHTINSIDKPQPLSKLLVLDKLKTFQHGHFSEKQHVLVNVIDVSTISFNVSVEQNISITLDFKYTYLYLDGDKSSAFYFITNVRKSASNVFTITATYDYWENDAHDLFTKIITGKKMVFVERCLPSTETMAEALNVPSDPIDAKPRVEVVSEFITSSSNEINSHYWQVANTVFPEEFITDYKNHFTTIEKAGEELRNLHSMLTDGHTNLFTYAIVYPTRETASKTTNWGNTPQDVDYWLIPISFGSGYFNTTTIFEDGGTINDSVTSDMFGDSDFLTGLPGVKGFIQSPYWLIDNNLSKIQFKNETFVESTKVFYVGHSRVRNISKYDIKPLPNVNNRLDQHIDIKEYGIVAHTGEIKRFSRIMGRPKQIYVIKEPLSITYITTLDGYKNENNDLDFMQNVQYTDRNFLPFATDAWVEYANTHVSSMKAENSRLASSVGSSAIGAVGKIFTGALNPKAPLIGGVAGFVSGAADFSANAVNAAQKRDELMASREDISRESSKMISPFNSLSNIFTQELGIFSPKFITFSPSDTDIQKWASFVSIHGLKKNTYMRLGKRFLLGKYPQPLKTNNLYNEIYPNLNIPYVYSENSANVVNMKSLCNMIDNGIRICPYEMNSFTTDPNQIEFEDEGLVG